ncbi:hypothetical protein Tco_1353238 [Tanacetum coccineum]
MDAFDVDLGFIERDATRTSDDVLALQEDRAKDREENRSMRVWVSGFMSDIMGWGAMEAGPSESIDVLAIYGDAKNSKSQGPPDGPK